MPKSQDKRFVSMADVARAAGVSQQTISRVANDSPAVSEKTRAHVKAIMAEMGYRPSFAGRSLKLGRYKSVGLVMFSVSGVGNLARFEGITSCAAEHGYAITLIEMNAGERIDMTEAARRMQALPVDGMIFNLNRMTSDFEQFQPLAGLTTVVITMLTHPLCTSVDSDQLGCSKMLVEHLLAHGHRNVHFVGGPEESISAQFRLWGWRETLEGHGIEAPEPLRGDWGAESGYEAGRMLAADPSCTAVYAANDQMAWGVVCALRDAGRRVPEDVSVVGVDDSLADFVPNAQLTSVRFDDHEVGLRAFEAAIDRNGGRQHILVPGRLVERSSVADLHL